MMYEYASDDGATFEVEASMACPPGETLEREGILYRRVYGFQTLTKERRSVARDPQGNRRGNDSLPRNWPFAKKFDGLGRPVFDSKAEQTEANVRAAAVGEFQGPRELSQPGDRPHIMRADD